MTFFISSEIGHDNDLKKRNQGRNLARKTECHPFMSQSLRAPKERSQLEGSNNNEVK